MVSACDTDDITEFAQQMRAWIDAWAQDASPPAALGGVGWGGAASGLWERRVADLFALQCRHIDGLPALAEAAVARVPWPLIPVSALQHAPLHVRPARERPAVVFETSGTTGSRPGMVRLHDAALYDAAAAATFARLVVGPAPPPRPPRVLGLLPTPALRPRSSLGHMVAQLQRRWDPDPPMPFLVGAGADGEGIDLAALQDALATATAAGRPVWVFATTIAGAALAEAWRDQGPTPLPPGSLWLDTGGPKGRRVTVDRAAQHRWLGATLGLEASQIVGEFGMTELASQRYEAVALAAAAGMDPGPWRNIWVGPPWLRSFVLHPETLAPLAEGEVGLIGHVDLANVDTLAFLLTADLGAWQPSPWGTALALHGRLRGADWRGCGLSVEELLSPAASAGAS